MTSAGSRFRTDVAPGVHLIEHGYTNCYVIEADDGLTLVDAGYPRTWRIVEQCLRAVGRRPEEIAGLIITHGHFDHIGFARPLRERHGVPIWAHGADRHVLAHPYRYRPQIPRLSVPLVHPRSWPVLGAMVAAGALTVGGTRADHDLASADAAVLPGRPVVVHTPGHTDGECVVHLPDRDALITGDALVTLDPYVGRRGPQIIAPSATHDVGQALTSLTRLRDLPARLVLPGHGDVWTAGVETAVAAAQPV